MSLLTIVVCCVIEVVIGSILIPTTGGVGCIPLIIGTLIVIGLKLMFF